MNMYIMYISISGTKEVLNIINYDFIIIITTTAKLHVETKIHGSCISMDKKVLVRMTGLIIRIKSCNSINTVESRLHG